MKIEHKIDFGSGFVSVHQPDNFETAEVDIIFSKDIARSALSNLVFVWKGDTAKKIFEVFEQGKSGGKGVAHALPYNIRVCDTNLTFELMLVLGHSSTKLSCDIVEVTAWAAQGADWFEKETNANSFWTSFLQGKLTAAEFKKTPYALTSIPNYTQVITLSFNELILLIYLYDSVHDLVSKGNEAGADTVESGIPIVGTPHVIVTIVHIADLIFKIGLVAVNIYSIGAYGKKIIDNIIQREKYKLCMREKDCFARIASDLGLQFSSSIYAPGSIYENTTYMPGKIVMPKFNQSVLDNLVDALFDRPENEDGNPKCTGYPDMTYAAFIDIMERKWNAEAKIIQGTLYFEEKHYWKNKSPYVLPNTGELGYTFNLPAPFRTNLSELAPYYEVAFRVDPTDLNTIHRYRGTSCAVSITDQHGITKYSGWGQGQIIDLGTALAKRKEYLTKVEFNLEVLLNGLNAVIQPIINIINGIIDVLDAVIDAINALVSVFNALGFNIKPLGKIGHISNPVPINAFAKRIGWMEVTNDTFAEPKTFIGVDIGGDWELHPLTESRMSAANLMATNHGLNLATRGNQQLIWENNKTKFCCDDYFQIYLSNVLKTAGGKDGFFDRMKWTLAKETARDIGYRTYETYLSGLSETILIDGTPP